MALVLRITEGALENTYFQAYNSPLLDFRVLGVGLALKKRNRRRNKGRKEGKEERMEGRKKEEGRKGRRKRGREKGERESDYILKIHKKIYILGYIVEHEE